MGKVLVGSVFAAMLLFFAAGPLAASDVGTCKRYTDIAVANAERVRELGGCNLALSDVSLSTSRARQTEWCLAVDTEVVKNHLDELADQTTKCEFCQSYARQVVAFGKDNIRFGCGFRNTTDPRWTPDYDLHFKGCMELKEKIIEDPGNVEITQSNGNRWWVSYNFTGLENVLGDMASDMNRCKKTHPQPRMRFLAAIQKYCASCHDSQTPALTPASVRPQKPGSSSGDNNIARQPPQFPSKRTTSGNDLVNPSSSQKRLLGPGLLDPDQGFGRQGPANAGSPTPSGPNNPNAPR